MLEVCVHRDHDVALHVLEADLQRRRLTIVAPKRNKSHAIVHRRKLLRHLNGPVAAAIVHEHELERIPRRKSATDVVEAL